jgi:hypothetical protein
MKPFSANPRKITERALDKLRQSLQELGDLGGIVYDQNSDQVVGGHQRLRAMFGEQAGEFQIKDADIELVRVYEEPTPQGTTGEGFITWKGGRYSFRQVKWDEETFRRANFIANTQAGEFDWSVFANTIDAADLQRWSIDPVEWLRQLKIDGSAVGNLLGSENPNLWAGMPEFEQKDLTAFRQITISFKNQEDLDAFVQLTTLGITESTKSIWYPE